VLVAYLAGLGDGIHWDKRAVKLCSMGRFSPSSRWISPYPCRDRSYGMVCFYFETSQILIGARGFCALSCFINCMGSKAIGRLAAFASWWTLGGTVVLVVTLLVKAPMHNPASFVFFDYENTTGYGSKGFVVMLGFIQAVYALEGAETAAQVAEEARNAEWLAPLGIASSVAGSWLVGVACE
jgi:amino acid transporter